MNDIKDRLIVFHGCDRKVGSTMVSRSVAKAISETVGSGRVLFAALNGTDDISYGKGGEATIETIKSRMEQGMMTGEELMSFCDRDGSMYVLGGVSGIIVHRNYSVKFSEMLISRALEVFDLVVCDCGNEIDCSLCIGGLLAGGRGIMVINQNESTLRRYEGARVLYNSIGAEFDSCVVNRYSDSDPHDMDYISSRLGKDSFNSYFAVREEKNVGRLAEMDGKLIMDYKCPGYNNDIKNIVYRLLTPGVTASKSHGRSGRRKNSHIM